MKENKENKQLWLGIVFLVLGGMLFIDNVDIFDFYIPHYIVSWPTFMVLLGAYLFFGRDNKVPGIVLMVIGSIFALDNIFPWWGIDFWDIFLPGILITIGIALMLRKKSKQPFDNQDIDYVDDVSVFSGSDKKITSQNFKGGRATAVFGGSKIDMRNADIGEENAELDLLMMFGGGEFTVPVGWTIKNEATAIFGAVSDKRSSVVNVVPDKNKVLTIRGLIIFGGVEINSP